MRIDPLGDRALILRDLGAPAREVAEWLSLQGIKGLGEAVASYDTVGLYFEASLFSTADLPSLLAKFEPPELSVPRRHEVPVCYELGQDLMEVSRSLSMTPLELIHLHCGKPYHCFAVGFCPGFAYLGHLPEELCGLPRRPEPRLKVAPGSVAITGSQTAVYPLERPGGWNLIGRTPLQLVDVKDAYFPIAAGDEVAFVPIPLDEFERLEGKRL